MILAHVGGTGQTGADAGAAKRPSRPASRGEESQPPTTSTAVVSAGAESVGIPTEAAKGPSLGSLLGVPPWGPPLGSPVGVPRWSPSLGSLVGVLRWSP